MKTWLCLIIVMLAVTKVLGAPADGDVTIRLSVQVVADANHTSLTFMCKAVVNNQTGGPLTVTNLFQNPAGLGLRVTDQSGKELARLYAAPFHFESFTLPAGEMTFSPYYGIMNRLAVPGTNTSVRLQLEGELTGSGRTERLTPNIVELKIP